MNSTQNVYVILEIPVVKRHEWARVWATSVSESERVTEKVALITWIRRPTRIFHGKRNATHTKNMRILYKLWSKYILSYFFFFSFILFLWLGSVLPYNINIFYLIFLLLLLLVCKRALCLIFIFGRFQRDSSQPTSASTESVCFLFS